MISMPTAKAMITPRSRPLKTVPFNAAGHGSRARALVDTSATLLVISFIGHFSGFI